jgi:hypothetical protein
MAETAPVDGNTWEIFVLEYARSKDQPIAT